MSRREDTNRAGVRPVRVAVAARALVGEAPIWDAATTLLHWVDILAGQIHSTELSTGRTTTLTVPTLVGAAAPRAAGGFVAATTDGFAEVSPQGELHTRLAILPDGIRMNDAKCDSRGRFWAGSTAMDFAPGRGALHLLSPDWTSQLVLDNLTQPNGLGWSPDDRTFYLVDTAERELTAFDFDPDTTRLSHRRTLVAFINDRIPDGLTIDAAGCLWVALWGGSRLERYDPEGQLLDVLPLPVIQPTSCTFAGTHRDVLCVTSASEGLTVGDGDGNPDGALLTVERLGVSGPPATPFAG